MSFQGKTFPTYAIVSAIMGHFASDATDNLRTVFAGIDTCRPCYFAVAEHDGD